MAKIDWKEPIEAMHGKIVGDFGAAKRKNANAKGEHYNFSVRYGKRDLTLHPVGTDEAAARSQFSAVSKLVGARRKNAQKRVQDAQAFAAQSTCKTLTEYLWSVCKAEYTASQS